MDRLQEHFLQQATFQTQDTEYHVITQCSAPSTLGNGAENGACSEGGHYEIFRNDSEDDALPTGFTTDNTSRHDEPLGTFRLIFQKERPLHVSGQQDLLPFTDVRTLKSIFARTELPPSYFQIADGSSATALGYTTYEMKGERQPVRFELVVHCLTKQGDWAMALSHRAKTGDTSAFLSTDRRVKSTLITDELKRFSDHAFHPMLLPCIVLSMTFHMATQRRQVIKDKLNRLEQTLLSIISRPFVTPASKVLAEGGDNEIAFLFGLLQSCRKDQDSRKGRTDFWNSLHAAIKEGFEYSEKSLAVSDNKRIFKGHQNLHQWMTLVWQRLQSLNERDQDHIDRLEDLSHMVCVRSR